MDIIVWLHFFLVLEQMLICKTMFEAYRYYSINLVQAGETSLSRAAFFGHTNVVRELLKKDPKIDLHGRVRLRF